MADKHMYGLLAANPLRPNQICTADGALEGPCMPDDRPDKQYVIMKAIEPSEETK